MPNNEELTQTQILKHYLIEKENPYLLDENNNGKTIMLSGAWGSGKTHFWQKQIEPLLKEKLKDKACVYVSLYGKESLSDIKTDVYLSANGKNILSTEVSTFGMEALSAIKDSDLAVGKALKAGKTLFDSKKMQKGIAKLKKGGIVCFDDFERKSKSVDLNDLFGFISQLAINLECKVIIILNSDVFKGKEAEVFTNVKEKTISKFFYYNPPIEELFTSISSDSKYDALNNYKIDILSAIKETEELNARIYTQVLDNCLEWVEVKKSIDSNIIRVLVLGTFNFVLNHIILDYQNIIFDHGSGVLKYNLFDFIDTFDRNYGHVGNCNSDTEYINILRKHSNENYLVIQLKEKITEIDREGKPTYSDKAQEEYLNLINTNQHKLKALWKYGHLLYFVNNVDKSQYLEISNFIETGILLP